MNIVYCAIIIGFLRYYLL